MSDPVIRLRGLGLEIAFPVPTRILHPCDLDIDAGTSTALVGPSGAGKSTLASLIGALQPASEGSYTYNGREIVGLQHQEAARFRADHVGFVFQQANLIDDRSAAENVALGLGHLDLSEHELATRVHEALTTVGLANIATRRAALLSGGERQRVAVARALVKQPGLIIADEPTGALDQRTGATVLELIFGMCAVGTTVLIVTHDMRAAQLAQRTLRIVDGRLVPRANTHSGMLPTPLPAENQ